jgi:formate hydrogenlyase transcriptional activator
MTALEACGGKVFGPGGAAAILGIKPTTLASRIKTFGIR